ncbi:nitric-oxide reductase large subunit [Natrinema gelatinilyticum]|uniref:nitric-oxide reductase large subunit n=1 Tax=Natrinema gelatinilyticum TaxID=2961571 RepID=UPI0020C2A0AF|nr:cbb3-type cytochrome c oxidase subunit I [Natrinema gelatinilyticum]
MEVRRRTLARILAVVFVFNLAIMGVGAWYSMQQSPPIPDAIDGPDGEPIVTESDVQAGKATFQSNGLMNHGSILGNGAYYGVDYTASALELKVQYMRDYYAQERYGTAYERLEPAEQAGAERLAELDLEETEPEAPEHSEAEAYAHEQVRQEFVDRYHEGSRERGVPAEAIESETDARRFADFALWTAWISHADRPGTDNSYTNNWPYQPGAGNTPTGGTAVWSSISLILLVGAAGIGIWLYKSVTLPEPETSLVSIPDPDEIDVFPSQIAATWFVLVAAVLFIAQTLLGAVLAHYYVERDAFYGIESIAGRDILQWLPFSIAKTYHLDLGILWIAALWLAAGLFLATLLTGHEPSRQRTYVSGLLGAIVVVTVGGFVGVWLGTNGYIDTDSWYWWLIGNEGLEYLEVGRLWQFGLLAGFGFWAVLVARGFKPLLDREPRYGLAHMILYAGGSIGLLFLAGMLYTPETSIVVTEFWRWWVVHMWVEGAFEFFIVAIVGVTLVSMGLLRRQSAEKAVMFQALFVMGTGVIGVSHHYWWVGQPDVWLPLGTVFSTLELIPLVLILFEALGQYRIFATSDETFPYTLPFMFIIASGAWNFLGAGVLGFFINLPLINYYEHGTYLTVAHAHASMFGAFGFLALGMATYMFRITVPGDRWSGRRLRWSFWLLNVGLAVMTLLSLMPVGFAQLEVAFTESYAASRSLAFYNSDLIQLLFWLRVPGDVMIILGAFVFGVDAFAKVSEQTSAVVGESDHPVANRVFSEDDD